MLQQMVGMPPYKPFRDRRWQQLYGNGLLEALKGLLIATDGFIMRRWVTHLRTMRTQLPQHPMPISSVGERLTLFMRVSSMTSLEIPTVFLLCDMIYYFCSNPNMPRSIRARVGATSDPIPKGKHIEEPKYDPPFASSHFFFVVHVPTGWSVGDL